jgi:hypothetical protein
MTHYELLRDIVDAWTDAKAAPRVSLERWLVCTRTLIAMNPNAQRVAKALAGIGAEIDARARRESRAFGDVCTDVHRDLAVGEVAIVDLLVEHLADAFADADDVPPQELAP